MPPVLVSELASEGASGRLLCQVQGRSMRASFGPFANGICVLTEKVPGPAGHFCPVSVVSLRKLVPFDETKKTIFLDFDDILLPANIEKKTVSSRAGRDAPGHAEAKTLDAKSPKSATRQHCKIENQKSYQKSFRIFRDATKFSS